MMPTHRDLDERSDAAIRDLWYQPVPQCRTCDNLLARYDRKERYTKCGLCRTKFKSEVRCWLCSDIMSPLEIRQNSKECRACRNRPPGIPAPVPKHVESANTFPSRVLAPKEDHSLVLEDPDPEMRELDRMADEILKDRARPPEFSDYEPPTEIGILGLLSLVATIFAFFAAIGASGLAFALCTAIAVSLTIFYFLASYPSRRRWRAEQESIRARRIELGLLDSHTTWV